MKDIIRKSFSYGKISGINLFAMPHPAHAGGNLKINGCSESESSVWEKIAEEINNLWKSNT